jgi:hypothetical protein
MVTCKRVLNVILLMALALPLAAQSLINVAYQNRGRCWVSSYLGLAGTIISTDHGVSPSTDKIFFCVPDTSRKPEAGALHSHLEWAGWVTLTKGNQCI